MKQPVSFEFTISGFIIGMIVIAMFAGSLAYFTAGLQDKYGVPGDSGLGKYNQTDSILEYTQEIRNSTDIKQEKGILDVIGGYFASGFVALKISVKSFDLFDSMLDDAATDIEYFGFFKNMFAALMIIVLFLGVIITAVVKWKV